MCVFLLFYFKKHGAKFKATTQKKDHNTSENYYSVGITPNIEQRMHNTFDRGGDENETA